VDEEEVALAGSLVASAQRITVLTGAGISTDSGIPDFRGPQGVWTKDPEAEKKATITNYLADPEVRRRAWRDRVDSPAWGARPNPGHRALVELERTGRLDTLVTQNIDGLHHAAGSDPVKVVEVHGTIRRYVCLECGRGGPMEDALERVRRGEDDPECLHCEGILKSATISFGQALVPEDLDRAQRAAAACDLLLTVGTTLSVYPVAYMVPTALRAGAALIIVNAEETPFDGQADVVVRGSISEVLPAVVGVTVPGS
jgi:NAD-dependent deacetylase